MARRSTQLMRSGAEILVDVPEFRIEADGLPPLTAAYPSSQVCDLQKKLFGETFFAPLPDLFRT